MQCAKRFDLLSEMSQEPRDEVWAAEAEVRLRSLIMAEPTPFTVRAVECRTSLCAIELASIYGGYHGDLDSDEWLHKNLRLWIGDFTCEEDPHGRGSTVTLVRR